MAVKSELMLEGKMEVEKLVNTLTFDGDWSQHCPVRDVLTRIGDK